MVQPAPPVEKTPPTQTIIIEKQAPASTTTTTVTDDEGTSVKVNDNGISVKNKNGQKVTNIGISRDSTSFEFKRPK